jgi:hypothetical protein
LTAGGRAFQLGIPGVPSVNTGGPAYDLILKHGRGPAAVRRNDFSKKYEKDDTDSNFYEYVRLRGQKIKAAMEETADTLKTVDTDTYAKFLKALSTKVNAEVETEMGLTRTTSSTSE